MVQKSSMKIGLKAWIIFSAIILSVAGTLSGCGEANTPTGTTSTTTGSTQTAGHVEVDYFYESDACFCLKLATEWVNTLVGIDYKSYIDVGTLVFNTYDTKDPSCQAAKEEFDSPSYGLFITTFASGEPQVKEVKSLWFYLDSSGTNELLKSKFFAVLTKELNTALGVQ